MGHPAGNDSSPERRTRLQGETLAGDGEGTFDDRRPRNVDAPLKASSREAANPADSLHTREGPRPQDDAGPPPSGDADRPHLASSRAYAVHRFVRMPAGSVSAVAGSGMSQVDKL